MRMKKGMIAAALAVVMSLGSTAAFAAVESPKPEPAPSTYIDVNVQDHKKITVTSEITEKEKGHVVKITSDQSSADQSKVVTLRVARTSTNKAVPITYVGDGKNGIFDSKSGRVVERVNLKSKKKMTLKKNVFKGSKVKKITAIKGTKVKFEGNAFAGTKVTNPSLNLSVKSSTDYVIKKDAFKGLSNKATVVITCKKKATYRLMVKKLKHGGFKGTITWKKG